MDELLIEKSEELLYKFFSGLSEKERKQIGLMGGWAVHYLLENKGIEHIGSRDIDIFFDPKTTKPKTISEKLEKMGFAPHSTFRWMKIFHSETKKELSQEESKKHPIYNLSYVYFDTATPTKIKHTMPEPLLKKVLKKENRFVKFKGLQILVPSPKAMVEMKLKSSPQRTDSFKRTKDISDLYALVDAYEELWQTKKGERTKTKGLNKALLKKFKGTLSKFRIDGTIAGAVNMLNKDQNTIADLLEKM